MSREVATMAVRHIDGHVSVIEIRGEITAASERPLMDAFAQASSHGTRAIVLDFEALEYMNSGGIGLLVTMLVRAQRQKQRLMAYGLDEHYRQIFELTRLDEAIAIYDSHDAAIQAAQAGGGS